MADAPPPVGIDGSGADALAGDSAGMELASRQANAPGQGSKPDGSEPLPDLIAQVDSLANDIDEGHMRVLAPPAYIGPARTFSFSIAAALRGMPKNARASAEGADGKPLPGWLKLDNHSGGMKAGNVPAKDLPYQFVIAAGNRRTVVTIEAAAR